MIAKWGGRQILFKRRLLLLREVNAGSPRAGVDATIDGNLRRVLDFHNAERCVLALQRTSVEPRNVIYTVARTDQRAGGAQELTEDSGNQLLRFGDSASVLYSSPAFPGASARATCVAADRKGERESTPASSDCEFVAGLLETAYFVAVLVPTERRHARASLPHLGPPSLHGRRGPVSPAVRSGDVEGHREPAAAGPAHLERRRARARDDFPRYSRCGGPAVYRPAPGLGGPLPGRRRNESAVAEDPRPRGDGKCNGA